MNTKNSPLLSADPSQRSYGFSEQIMKELRAEKDEVDRIRRQRLRVHDLKEEFIRKDSEMKCLQTENRQLQKYRPYVEKYGKLKEMLDESVLKYEQKEKENGKLLYELDKALIEIESLQKRSGESDKSRGQLLKERSHLERLNKEIEETFHEYKQQCKLKEKELTDKLERAYRQIKDDRRNLEQLESVRSQLLTTQRRVTELQQQQREKEQHSNHLMEMLQIKDHELIALRADYSKRLDEEHRTNSTKFDEPERSQLAIENQQLRKELFDKEKQLQKSKALNQYFRVQCSQLSIEFDRSVSRIGEFEKELSEYRRENHELKKTLTLFLQKEKYSQLQKQIQQRNEQEEEEDDSFSEQGRISSRIEANYHERVDGYM